MTAYREILRAPASWWVAVAAFALACGWIVRVATTLEIGLVTGVVTLALLGAGLWRWGGLRIDVSDAGLTAGRAVLEPQFAGPPEVLDSTDYRRKLGTEANALALLVTRPWAERGVVVPIDDANDPTPYWIIGSTEPQQLTEAIDTMRAHAQGKV